MEKFIWLLFALPLLNLLAWPLVGRKRTPLSLLPTGAMAGLVVYLLFQVPAEGSELTSAWLQSQSDFDWRIYINLSRPPLLLASSSCLISLLIQLFSLRYLDEKQPFGYYFFLMSLFTGAMSWLFLAGNLFTMLLGWELVGICSYFLVQFWYLSERPVQAGFRVLLLNKLGDVSLIAGLGLLFSFGLGGMVFNRLQIPEGAGIFFDSNAGLVLCLFLVTGSLVKSAQFPFQLWLKEAMEGPTSVSALLHSATMVVAGAWLLIRLSPMFGPVVQHFLIAVGAISLLLSAVGAVFTRHFKSLLAFSTLMQLALLVIAIGLGKSSEASLHIFTHAWYKSALFLICGMAMHWAHDLGYQGKETQFLPSLKGYLRNKPIARFAFLFCVAALAGIPLTSGYLSKESLIPDVFHGTTDPWVWVAYTVMQLGIMATAFYGIRLVIWLCFLPGNPSIEGQRIGFVFGAPVLLLSAMAGFWVVGPNPFSTEGWLLSLLGQKGGVVHLDFGFLAIGLLLGWLSIRKGQWELSWKPRWAEGIFVEMSPHVAVFQHAWRWLVRLSTVTIRAEQKLIEQPLDFGSKAVVVSGHLLSFTDKKMVDGVVVSLAGLARWIGTGLWHHSRNQPQYVVYFVILVMTLLGWFWLG